MTSPKISKAAVVGAGAMGSQIAFLAAYAGCSVTLVDEREEALTNAEGNLRRVTEKSLERGTLTEDDVSSAFSRLSFTTDLASAVEHVDIVIEAIIEDLGAKKSVFSQLNELAPSNAILATNSSSIVSSKLADVQNPGRVCNMHFFNPAIVMKLVEIVGGDHTSENTLNAVSDLATRMGKTPVVLHKEIFGFVVNRVVGAIFDESIALLEQGVASVEDIDTAVTLGLGHPIGPFALLDLTGIDVNVGIKQLEAEDSGDPSRGPSKTLLKLLNEGHLGRKSGHGFYDYGAK